MDDFLKRFSFNDRESKRGGRRYDNQDNWAKFKYFKTFKTKELYSSCIFSKTPTF